MNLEIEIVERENQSIVNLIGEIDIYTAPQLKDKLLPLSEKEEERIIIDLTHVNYMDSTGLGVFISILKSSKEHQSTFKLINLNKRIERLFTITGLHEIIDISPLAGGVEVENDGTV